MKSAYTSARRVACWFTVAALAGSSMAHSQIVSGNIVGGVRDSSGAAVAGTKVVARSVETNQVREAVTNETGEFAFSTLRAGLYKISATHPGFKSTVTSEIDLRIDQTARIDLVLQVGQVTEEITVSAEGAFLQTDTATLGQVIGERPVVDLPLNGRNFLQLASLSAGVVPSTSTSSQSARLGRSSLTTHVAGSRGSANSFLIDGIEARGARLGEITVLPSPDTIKEFKIQRNYYSAEYGDNPGVISLSTKSGANVFHGGAYEFLRNSALDVPQYFDQGQVAPFKQNQFGANLGGRILRDRTFFFGAYDGTRRRRANQNFAVVPDPKNLTGNFSGLTDAAGKPIVITDPFNRNLPFANNTIPVDRLSKIAVGFNKFIPAPNTNLPQGNYTGNPATLDDTDQYLIKVDHRISDKDTFFARYSTSNWSILNQALLPFAGSSLPLDNKVAAFQETHIFGPAAVNTLKIGFNRAVVANSNETSDTNLAAQLGFKNLSVDELDYSLPRFALNGFTQMGHSQQTFHQWTNAYVLSDTLALVKGQHNVTMGFDLRAYRSPQSTTNGTNGRVTVSNIFTGYSVADYLLGAYQQATAFASVGPGDYRYQQHAIYAQDNYKVTQRLTLNVGLRWEYHSPWKELGGSEGYFDEGIGALRLAQSPSIYGLNLNTRSIVVGGVESGVIAPSYKQFAPRIGFAYKLNNKTVIRSGFGIFWITNQGSHTIEISVNPGAAVTVTATNSRGQIPRLLDTLFDTVAQSAQSGGGSLQTVHPGRRPSYMQQWNLNIQRELPGSMLLDVSYVGSAGVRLIGVQDINAARLNGPGENLSIAARRPYPAYSFIQQYFAGEQSNYNALLATLERRFSRGMSFLTSYTYSKSIDNGSAALSDAQVHQDRTNRRAERSLSAFDARNRLSFSGTYELPFGQGKKYFGNTTSLARYLATGWQVNAIAQFQSGLPFSPTVTGDVAQTGGQSLQRPNRLANGNLPVDQRTADKWFDTSAFAIQTAGTFGNAGRNTLAANGTKNVDLSIFKNNYFGHERRFNLQYRAELFNLLNDTNFAAPAAVLNGPRFGVISSTGPAREIQFALKLLF